MTDFKAKIIEELDVLRKTSKSEPAGAFKSRVYATAIKTLSEMPGPVHTMADIPEGKGKGIGEKVYAKIQEIITTGHLGAANRARANKAPDSLDAFTKIYGVGPAAAAKFVAAGYRTIGDLRKAVAEDSLKLTKNQLVGLSVYEDLLERIPHAEMLHHEYIIKSHDPGAVLLGSFRRGAADSGDIDVLTTDLSIVDRLFELGYVTDVLAKGDHKCLCVCRLPGAHQKARRLDFMVTAPEERPFAILYFTGSDTFNVAMRARAADMGFRLNEHGIIHVKSGKPVTGIRSEQDIFGLLHMRWKEPHERLGDTVEGL